MLNFRFNRLFLLSRIEYPTCAVFAMLDRDTQPVYCLFDFTKRLCAALLYGRQSQQRTLYLMITLLLTAREGPACAKLSSLIPNTDTRLLRRLRRRQSAYLCLPAAKTGGRNNVKTGANDAVLSRR